MGRGCEHSSSPRAWGCHSCGYRDVTPGGMGAGLGGEGALSWLLALRAVDDVWIQKWGQVCPSSGTSLLLGNHFCSLPSQTRARGHYLLAAPGCSLSLMEHFSWDVALPAGKVSPGHRARWAVDELPCGCGQDVWQVSRCGAHLPGHSGPSLPASIPPSKLPVLPGSSPRGQPRGTSVLTISAPESGPQGHNSVVSQVQTWSVTLRRQLGACCPILFPHKALPLPVPQFPCLATFPQHHRDGTAAVPQPPAPPSPPGLRPPRPRALGALPSLLTLIKILQHGGRKCIFSSSAAAIRLPGNGWLAGGQGSGGLRRRGRRAERSDQPVSPVPILLDVPVLCQAVPTRSPCALDARLPGDFPSWWG